MSDKPEGEAQSERTSDWAFLKTFVIPNLDDPDEIYLKRWRIIQTPWWALYLHRMDGPDSRLTLHDHPWSFVSIILRGGYWEHRLEPRTRKIFRRHRTRINVMRRDDFHAIESIDRTPTWTLLFVGKRRRTWGYLEMEEGESFGDRWTEFNKHPYDTLFQEALEHRRNLRTRN